MVNQMKRRFFFLILAVLAISAVLSVAGHVVDAAIGRGQARALAAQILGGPSNNWQPRRLASEEDRAERMARLRELATDGRYIHTLTHIFDPLRDPNLPSIGALRPPQMFNSKRGGQYYIVQQEGDFLHPEFKTKVAATGAEIVNTMPVTALVVRASTTQMEQIGAFAETRWTGPYHPFYRIDPSVLGLVSGEREGDYLDDKGRVTLFVDFMPGERASDYAGEIRTQAAGGEALVLDEQPASRSGVALLEVDARALPGVLTALSSIGGVRAVTAAPRPVPLNEDRFVIHQTYDFNPDPDVAGKVHARGVVGFRQVITILDGGLENNMCEFLYGPDVEDATFCQLLDPITNPSQDDDYNITDPCNKVIAYYRNDLAACYEPSGGLQHGTFVTGVAAGDNYRTTAGGDGRSVFCQEDATGPFQVLNNFLPSEYRGPFTSGAGRWDGLAPGAQIVVQDRGAADGALTVQAAPTFGTEINQAWLSGSRYQNNSWGTTNQSTYNSASQSVDNFLFARRTMNVIWAAGNTGADPPPSLSGFGSVAKNTITVGEAVDDGAGVAMGMALGANGGSSKGPTQDGRIKPDLAAKGPGTSTTAVSPSPATDLGNPGIFECNETRTGSGTSFSTPAVTALAALVGQYFEDGYYPSGAPTRGPWAVPGLKISVDDPNSGATADMQLNPDVNPNADRCAGQAELCDPGDSFRPTNALIKAVLLNSTVNMTGSNTGADPGTSDARPNTGQGWGLPILDRTLYFEGDTYEPGPSGESSGLLVLSDTPNGVLRDFPLTDVREDVVFKFEPAFSNNDNPNEIKEWDVTILPGEPLTVTLCWSDPGEGFQPGQVLRNDLDLELIGPNPFDPSVNIAWRPNPEVAYTGTAANNFVRDGFVQTETLLDSFEAFSWLGKDAPPPADKGDWPDFASADRFNNCEQIALRTDDVVGGSYKIRIINWNIRAGGGFFSDGQPDYEAFDKSAEDPGAGTDNVELDEQGFALLLSGAFATDQGVISFNRTTFGCGDGEMGQITLRDENGCADPDPTVDVSTTVPNRSFPADFEVFQLIPEFPCDPTLPADHEDQPKVFRTPMFPVEDTANPSEVIQGDGTITLAVGETINARYEDVEPLGGISTARATLRCLAAFVGDGYQIEGGCDLTTPGQPEGPQNPKDPDQFLDAGELAEYTVFFINTGTQGFNDVHVTMSLLADDPANPEATILNNPVYVGEVPAGRRASATFLVQMADPIPPQKRLTFEFAITSPADDLIEPLTFQQVQKVESDIQVYTYNTADPRGTRFGQGLIEELRPGADPAEGATAYVEYNDMLVDPGEDGNYDTADGSNDAGLVGDDQVSANDFRFNGGFDINENTPMGNPWDFDDSPDQWTHYNDPIFDGQGIGTQTDQWVWNGTEPGDRTQAGGCGWATAFEAPVGESGNGIWHTGTLTPGGPGDSALGPVHPETTGALGLAENAGPNPGNRPASDDIFSVINNTNPTVCATYKKQPNSMAPAPAYLWHLVAPDIRKVTTSTEFQVNWQRFTMYTRLFGHRSARYEYSAFVLVMDNEPLPGLGDFDGDGDVDDWTYREPEFFSGIFAETPAGPQQSNPIAADWTDPTDNTFSWNLASPDQTFPDRTFEDVFGPPSPQGWEMGLVWFFINDPGANPVPNHYGFGVDNVEFVWTESRETDDQTDCADAIQDPRVFFAQTRYNLCEGDLEISVIDPNPANCGLGSVYVRVTSNEEPIPGEIVKLRQSSQDMCRYDGRMPFTVDVQKNIRGVLLVSAGQNDTAQGADTVFVQYDPREPQDNSDLGVADWQDEGWPGGGPDCDAPDGENDDYRLNCTGTLGDPSTMTEAPDDDGDGCPDGDGVADAEDDCDAVAGIDEAATGQDCSAISDACPAGGYEANDFAFINCPGGNVFYIRHELIPIDGDADQYADRNEEHFLSIDLLNLFSGDLRDATVRISTEDDTICLLKDEAFYGDIPGVTTAQLLGLDRREMITSTPANHPVTGEPNWFRLGVPPETVTASLDAIQKATLRVDVFADNFSTAGTSFNSFDPITVEMLLDLDVAPNGQRADFVESFCNASGGNCAAPPNDPSQTWYTQPEWWGQVSGVLPIDSTQVYPDNGGFCPECDVNLNTECSVTDPAPGSTDPPCERLFDGGQGIGDWHIEESGVNAPDLGTTKTGQYAIHWGDDSIQTYSNTQLSALTLPELYPTTDTSVVPELRFWQIAELWLPNFTSGLSTPIGATSLQINTDAPAYPESSWRRLNPIEGSYSHVTDTLIACRGAFCETHHPVFANVGDWDEGPPGANGTTPNGRWVQSIVDLSDYRGQPIRIRFLTSVLQDINVAQETNRGWTIDDITMTGLGTAPGLALEADPLPEPGPCGLQASFTIQPGSTCLSSPVQFADTHVGLGESDGAGGREPIAYEWDFDGDGTPEIACSDNCLEGEDIAGRGTPNANVAIIEGNCEAPLVTFGSASNFRATMTLCQAGQVQDTATDSFRVRPDLGGNVSVDITPLLDKGDPACPNDVALFNPPLDLDGDGDTDAADQTIFDNEFVGCVPQGTRVHQTASVAGGQRTLSFCWSNQGQIVCGDASGENFFRYDSLGAFPDFLTAVDNEGGCSETVPLGIVVIPGAEICIQNVAITDGLACGGTGADGFIDPGEYVQLDLQVENCGDSPLREPVAELRTPDQAIQIWRAAGRLESGGDPFVLDPGETATVTFEALVSDLHECEGVLSFNMDVYTWDRTFDAQANFTVPIGQSNTVSDFCQDSDLTGNPAGNALVCDPGNGNETAGCPSAGPDPNCCPALQTFQTDGNCPDGTVTDICVTAQLQMFGPGNHADELNVTLIGPGGQSFPILQGNPNGATCQTISIDLCTSDNTINDEGTAFTDCVARPLRGDDFYDDFRAAFRNSPSGGPWTLQVQDAQQTTTRFNAGMITEVQSFRVDADITTTPVCNPKALQTDCLVDEDGPIFGGANGASGCSTVAVSWYAALDQIDEDDRDGADSTMIDYEVYRADNQPDCSTPPALGDFTLIDTVQGSTLFLDDTVDTANPAYWYRVVAIDQPGDQRSDSGDPLNPDDMDHWVCVELADLCPPPIPIGKVKRYDDARDLVEVTVTGDASAFDGLRLYRGNILTIGGRMLEPANQDHEVADGIVGNCFEPTSSPTITDDDTAASRSGTGSFYYLVNVLAGRGAGQQYVEGSLDTVDFPAGTQVTTRVPPGNHDCPPE